jgi:hypothetical protein
VTPDASDDVTIAPRTVTPAGGTAFTGPAEDAFLLGLAAMGLLVLGTGLMYAGYQRRRRHET